ncbi:hypothetical protein BA718_10215 [Streptococcus gallolyticus subsp. gallolyticus]|uniref:hypothetical protein n=1 Tax=Streptococcus gallolyticus TaxID=315405 RepID=UPI00081BE569|nr:hypothetical protein [Streptococcus gallolyticus]OCW49347.1 hypothetical protein BA718_10215 [Streptococcus gallolyticus subsp. gallolyticus]
MIKSKKLLTEERGLATMSRAEQSRAEQSRAEQSRAEQSRAEQSRAESKKAFFGVQLFILKVTFSCIYIIVIRKSDFLCLLNSNDFI